ncbi:general odorant-binding protein 56a-like [Neodiprion virginianus]|uniref:General odorant-binding protein 56a n=1 Tax=Neodiprion lecontei TaxID=441921 RepID=A0A6J0B946_NEOLC|nr:general odorant-binding protein 56a [Neodiprion lecontei]XP_046625191.1 general odorant-binding protein 56a-like [Neodiprion virginianus]
MRGLTFGLIAVFAVIQMVAGNAEKWKQYTEECAQEMEITPEMIAEVQGTDELRVDRTIKCFLACALEKAGVLQGDKLRKDVIDTIAQHMEESGEMPGAVRVANKCYDEAVVETERCNVAGALMKCVHHEKQAGLAD